MKTILSVFTMLLVISVTTYAKFSDPICFADTCTNQYNLKKDTLYLDAFPSCPIYVYYWFRICNGEMQLQIESVGYNVNDTNCNSFLSWKNDAAYKFEHAKQMYAELYLQIDKKVFLHEYSILPDSLKYILECPNGVRKYSYIQVYCTKFCGYLDTLAGVEYIVQIACNNLGCCRVEKRLCWNTNTSQLDVTETKTSTGTLTCVTIPPTIVSCPTTYILSGGFTGGNSRTLTSSGYSSPCGITCD
jgi:hypothetical protein